MEKNQNWDSPSILLPKLPPQSLNHITPSYLPTLY